MIKPIHGMGNDADAMYFLHGVPQFKMKKGMNNCLKHSKTLQRKVDVSLFETATCGLKKNGNVPAHWNSAFHPGYSYTRTLRQCCKSQQKKTKGLLLTVAAKNFVLEYFSTCM